MHFKNPIYLFPERSAQSGKRILFAKYNSNRFVLYELNIKTVEGNVYSYLPYSHIVALLYVPTRNRIFLALKTRGILSAALDSSNVTKVKDNVTVKVMVADGEKELLFLIKAWPKDDKIWNLGFRRGKLIKLRYIDIRWKNERYTYSSLALDTKKKLLYYSNGQEIQSVTYLSVATTTISISRIVPVSAMAVAPSGNILYLYFQSGQYLYKQVLKMGISRLVEGVKKFEVRQLITDNDTLYIVPTNGRPIAVWHNNSLENVPNTFYGTGVVATLIP